MQRILLVTLMTIGIGLPLGCKGPETYANCPTIGFGDAGENNWPVGCGHPCIGCTEKGVGFTKPIHTVAKMLNVAPPLQYPRISEDIGKGSSFASAASASLATRAASRWGASWSSSRFASAMAA